MASRIMAFRLPLSAIPSVPLAAVRKAFLTSSRPAPLARLDLVKMVKCFFADVAISMCPPGIGASPVNTAGVTLAQSAFGIFFTFEYALGKSVIKRMC